MEKQIIGMAIMLAGALVTFLSVKITKIFFKKVEKPKESLHSLLIKVGGLGIAVIGMLVIMDIL